MHLVNATKTSLGTLIVAMALIWVPAQAQPTGIVITLDDDGFDIVHDPARNLLYVTHVNNDDVLFISTETYTIVNRVYIGSDPFGLDLSPDGDQLFIAQNWTDAVTILDPRRLRALAEWID